MLILHTAVAILLIVLLIIAVRVDPVIALVVGSIYLGLATGLGFEKTITTIVQGFGDIMAEVGLLIGFGVLLGSLLFAMGALQRVVTLLLRLLGPRRLPYAMGGVLATIFPSIYVDVQLVLAAPLARSAAPQLGRDGLGRMGGALGAGIMVGYVFVVPGLSAVSIAGLLKVPLGTMLLYGLPVGIVTVVLTTFLFGRLLRLGYWNPAVDELEPAEPSAESDGGSRTDDSPAGDRNRGPHLALAMLPIAVALILIAVGAVTEALGVDSAFLTFLGDPVLALFVGMLGAYVIALRSMGRERTEHALGNGFSTSGQILLITGIGGSLGAVIAETGLADVLGGLFSAESGGSTVVTILLAWSIAALMHIATGSVSVAAITAAGILGPIVGQLDTSPAVLGLSIGAGALFALHVNSNFFWMFQSLLKVSTRGTLKALTGSTTIASIVALPLIVVLGFLA